MILLCFGSEIELPRNKRRCCQKKFQDAELQITFISVGLISCLMTFSFSISLCFSFGKWLRLLIILVYLQEENEEASLMPSIKQTRGSKIPIGMRRKHSEIKIFKLIFICSRNSDATKSCNFRRASMIRNYERSNKTIRTNHSMFNRKDKSPVEKFGCQCRQSNACYQQIPPQTLLATPKIFVADSKSLIG